MEFHKVLFLVHYFFYKKDMPKMTTKNPKCTLYADDTGIIVSNPSCEDLKIKMNKLF